MSYFGRLIGFAFQRSFVRTDIIAAALGALGPAVFFLAGQPVPDDLPLYISLLVAALLGAVVLLRVAAAPYLIWKEDQATIAALRLKVESPKLEEQRIMRSRLAEERVELAGRTAAMTEAIQSARTGAACMEVIDTNRAHFLKFSYNADIRASWRAFENAAFVYGAGFPNRRKMGDKAKADEFMEAHRQAALPVLDRATNDLLCTLLDQPKLTE